MDIIISKRLKEFRAKKGNTQEDLANYLSISIPAVSKWERGEGLPDVTLLPKIAAYYDVTLDELFGVDEMRKRERIDRYKSESQKLQNVGKIPEAAALWREALKEFPNDHEVISQLSQAIFFQSSGDTERFKEVIELSERILRESTDQTLRDSAIQKICFSYKHLGDGEKAREYAEMGGNMYSSWQSLLSEVLSGDEKEDHNKRMIAEYADLIGFSVDRLNSIPWEKRHEFYLRILELIFDDGFYGFYACRAAERHYNLARIYAGRENSEDKVRYHLEQTVKFAKQYDGLSGEYTYTSTFMKGVTENADKSTTNGEGTECEWYLEALRGESGGVFERFRGTEWFGRVIEGMGKG